MKRNRKKIGNARYMCLLTIKENKFVYMYVDYIYIYIYIYTYMYLCMYN